MLDPAPLHLQMPTVLFPECFHDGGGLACFDDGHDLIGLGTPEVALNEVITPAWRIFLNGYTPFLRAVLDPVVILRSDVPQHLPTDGISLTIGPKKADGALFLLKGLDRGVEQDAIEATINETDVILMVVVEGVHGVLALQMRRAAVSVPANIAEGFRRRGKADKARYMNVAEASLEESRYYLILAQDLGYGETGNLTTSLEEVSRLLNAYASAILASES